MNVRVLLVAAMILVLTGFGPLRAETSGTPELFIPFLETEPTLDDFSGMRVPEHLAGKLARVSGFTQRTPDDGRPGSQPTEIYLGYDREHLYAIFLAFDSEPERIRANMAPRGNAFDDDSVNIMIDTFNDQRRAYFFLSTPRGIQADGQYTEAGGFDGSFEAVWDSDTRLTDRGFMVRFKIPFRSLRFPDTPEQTWRVIFNRTIQRTSEDLFWPRYTLAIEGRLNQTAQMKGIRDISPSRNLQLIPFVFFRDFRTEDRGLPGGDVIDDGNEEAVGLDAKLVIKDALVLDLTANPDFSQVESDEPQVTVNQRFEVFFPERRPFFLENTDVFQTPTNLVFTRRIEDPNGGAKLTGKLGRYALGAILIDDDAPEERAKIGILRMTRDFSEQSRIGVLLTDREQDEAYNRVGALDGRIKLNDNWVGQFQFAGAGTETAEGDELDGVLWSVHVDRSGKHLTSHTHYQYTSPGFRTDLGFLGGMQRPDSQNLHQRLAYRFRPVESSITEWGPSLFLQRFLDAGGEGLSWTVTPEMTWRWAADTGLLFKYDHVAERLFPEEFDTLSAPKEFPQNLWAVVFETDRWARFGFETAVEAGRRINFVPPEGEEPELAEVLQTRAELKWRPVPPLRLELSWIRTELNGRNGSGRIFTNDIGRIRANWQFTRELSLRLITDFQHTDAVPGRTSLTDDDQILADVLFRYLWNPWQALYIGYTSSTRDFLEESTRMPGTLLDRSQDGRQVFVKFSYLFQL